MCLLFFLAALALVQCRWPFARDVVPAVLDVRFPSTPETFDPAQAADAASRTLVSLLFSRLTRLSPDGNEVLPELATEWKVSGDGRIYTFFLRQDAVWVDQNGQVVSSLTAADIVWTFRRLCDPATGSADAPLFYVIEGCQAAHTATGTPDLEGVDVRAVDDFTVEFTLTEPAAYFPALLAMPSASPLPHGAIEEGKSEVWTSVDRLLTSGPYTVQTWEPERRLVLVQNDAFFAANDVSVSQVNVHIVPDDVQAVERYDRNALDVVDLAPALAAVARHDKARQPEMRLLAKSCSVFAGFVTVKPPLDYRLVRQALSEAVDREGLVEEVLGGNGLPARHLAPPGVFGAPPADQVGVAPNPEHAQEVLARAGYPGGQGFPPITVVYPQDVVLTAVAQHLARTWEETLGIEVRLEGYEAQTYPQRLDRTLPLEEAPHVWLFRYCTSSPEAYYWLNTAFHCQESPNWSRRVCDAFDTLLEQAAAERDPANRRELYAQAEDALAVEEVAYAPLYHEAQAILVKPWLQLPERRATWWDIARWSLDMTAKQAAQEQ